MTKEQYLLLVEKEFEAIKVLIKQKNSDYTGESSDPFANFKLVEQIGVCSTETGILTRLCDKFSRVVSLTSSSCDNKVKDEPIEDTLRDIIGYSILFLGYLKSKKMGELTAEEMLIEQSKKLFK